uniref:Integrase catalytic domain-containing protein n=1 Tax=Acrobeloides nanus TaxID=290746 RepID=A0A914CT21_9BILA
MIIASPMKDERAITVAKKLIKDVITVYGCPEIISSDQGSQFTSDLFENLAEMFGINQLFTTAYRAQANGQVEKANSSILKLLRGYANTEGNDWDNLISLLTFTYNTSINISTIETPFFLTHGYDATLPMDVALQIRRGVTSSDLSNFKELVATKLEVARAQVVDSIKQAQRVQKEQYDNRPRRKENDFTLGELVLAYLDAQRDGNKLRRAWLGPFRIIDVKRPNVTIRGLTEQDMTTIHMDKIKHYYESSVLPLRMKGYRERLEGKDQEPAEERPTATSTTPVMMTTPTKTTTPAHAQRRSVRIAQKPRIHYYDS